MTLAVSETRFPGETHEYRRARNELLEAEIELRRHIEAVAAQRRRLRLGCEVPTDYVFQGSAPGDEGFKTVRLSELFQPGKDSLFLYSFMYPENTGPMMTPCAGSEHGQDLRHLDFMWPMWSIFDCTPEGRDSDWGPSLAY